jgi:hypothetical protein
MARVKLSFAFAAAFIAHFPLRGDRRATEWDR